MFPNAQQFGVHGSQFNNVHGGMHVHAAAAAVPGPIAQPPDAVALPVARPTSPGPEDRTPTEIYCDLLSRRGRGFPLHVPEPQRNLPQEYRDAGVSIGDVGRVTPEGIWDYFFNIFRSAEDPVNGPYRVPDGFLPLRNYEEADLFNLEYEARAFVTSPCARINNPNNFQNFPGGEFRFSCRGPQGALLALPHGSKFNKLPGRQEEIRQYAAKYALSWYQHINGTLGRRMANGELYLITGWEKSLAGGIATFQDVAPGDEFDLAYKPFPNPDSQYRFSQCPAQTRTFSATTAEDGRLLLNNTVFVHGYTISLGEGLWGKLFGRVGISQITDSPPRQTREGFVPFGGTQDSGWSFLLNLFTGGDRPGGKQHGASDESVAFSDLSPLSMVGHPALNIHRTIHRLFPQASVVIIHDDDWRDILFDDETMNSAVSENVHSRDTEMVDDHMSDALPPVSIRKRPIQPFRISEKDGHFYLTRTIPSRHEEEPSAQGLVPSVQNMPKNAAAPSALPDTHDLRERSALREQGEKNDVSSQDLQAGYDHGAPELGRKARMDVNRDQLETTLRPDWTDSQLTGSNIRTNDQNPSKHNELSIRPATKNLMPQATKSSGAKKELLTQRQPKRARVALSCAECRRLKLKCDNTVPCSSCKRRGCSAICPNGSLITGQGTRFVLADTEKLHHKIATMSDRIRHLEDALAILQSTVTNEPHPLLEREMLKIKSILGLHAAIDSADVEGPPPGPSGAPGEAGDGEPLKEYIDAFGTLAIREDEAATFYGRSAGSESLLVGEAPRSPSSPSAVNPQEELIKAYEAEEEHIINVLSKTFEELKANKIELENAPEAKSESHVNQLSKERSNLGLTQQAGPSEPPSQIVESLLRDNEVLRSRLVEAERDYARVSRLNEIYREELLEHRNEKGLPIDHLVGLTDADSYPQSTH